MTTLIATLPPSFSDTTSAVSPAAASAGTSDSDFSFDGFLSFLNPLIHDLNADTSNSELSLHDVFSVLNPLQHLPIVSTLYRAVTGDTIKPFERIAGDALYGGLWGFVSSVANVAFQQITGKDFGDTALALLEGDDGDQPVGVAASAAASSASQPSAVAQAAPATVATPQLPATAPPALLQRRTAAMASAASADNTTALTLMMAAGQGTGDSSLNQRATTAYGKALALPVNYSADLAPVY